MDVDGDTVNNHDVLISFHINHCLNDAVNSLLLQ